MRGLRVPSGVGLFVPGLAGLLLYAAALPLLGPALEAGEMQREGGYCAGPAGIVSRLYDGGGKAKRLAADAAGGGDGCLALGVDGGGSYRLGPYRLPLAGEGLALPNGEGELELPAGEYFWRSEPAAPYAGSPLARTLAGVVYRWGYLLALLAALALALRRE